MTAEYGERFRTGMAHTDEAARRYAEEHRGRLRRGQSNGSAAMVAEYEGKAQAAHYMAHDSRTESSKDILEMLSDMETRDPPSTGIDDKDSFRQGYFGFIREVRARFNTDLPQAESE